MPELVEAPVYESDGEDEDIDHPDPGIASRTRSQTGTQTRPTGRYTMASTKGKKKTNFVKVR